VTLASLPLFVRLGGRAVILLGEGEAADAKRRLLERAGAVIVDEEAEAAFAIVAIDDDAEAEAAVARLKACGVLVNAVDRPALCDFTIPAIVERGPVVVAVGTNGVSAGLAAALRQRLEALLPTQLGQLAQDLHAARAALRDIYPDSSDRRRAIAAALAPGGALDPLGVDPDVSSWLGEPRAHSAASERVSFILGSPDPDDLTLRQARALASADRVIHAANVPPAILDRARADALRIESAAPPVGGFPGLTVYVRMA
jgi:uroporphyrin-III C-methyltransferase / precorrin-2 dehydrogenase / sirohydrochlorin ferrochelatase